MHKLPGKELSATATEAETTVSVVSMVSEMELHLHQGEIPRYRRHEKILLQTGKTGGVGPMEE